MLVVMADQADKKEFGRLTVSASTYAKIDVYIRRYTLALDALYGGEHIIKRPAQEVSPITGPDETGLRRRFAEKLAAASEQNVHQDIAVRRVMAATDKFGVRKGFAILEEDIVKMQRGERPD